MRRTAQRVDDQLLTHMQAHAIAGPWAAGERVLVCVSEDPRSAGLVRYAKRLADRLRAPWTALTIESRRSAGLSEERARPHRRHPAARRAPRGRGGHHPGGGRRIADDVIAYARDNNVTQIVIGKSTRSRWFEMLHGSVVHELVRRAGNISVHVIAGEEVAAEPARAQDGPLGDRAGAASDVVPYAGRAILAVAAALASPSSSSPSSGSRRLTSCF